MSGNKQLAVLVDPQIPGAQLVIAEAGVVLFDEAIGHCATYQDDRTPALAPDPVSAETLFDLASITKLFTAVAVMQLRDQGLVELDAPLGRYLPQAAAGAATVRQALTHTAGLPPEATLHTVPGDVADRRRALLSLTPVREPGVAHEYSCVGYLLAGLLVEAVTGQTIAERVRLGITEPLGMDAGFLPADPLRCAATEYAPELGRGVVRGQVHDESSWAVGGIGGNAGMFSSARALLRFAEAIRRGGADAGGCRILAADTVAEMLTPQSAPGAPFGQGIGFRLGDADNTGSATSVGHTGFTGTLLCIEPHTQRSTVFLSNAVHPRRGIVDKPAQYRRVAAFDPGTSAH